jgi:hypothetical protein
MRNIHAFKELIFSSRFFLCATAKNVVVKYDILVFPKKKRYVKCLLIFPCLFVSLLSPPY